MIIDVSLLKTEKLYIHTIRTTLPYIHKKKPKKINFFFSTLNGKLKKVSMSKKVKTTEHLKFKLSVMKTLLNLLNLLMKSTKMRINIVKEFLKKGGGDIEIWLNADILCWKDQNRDKEKTSCDSLGYVWCTWGWNTLSEI